MPQLLPALLIQFCLSWSDCLISLCSYHKRSTARHRLLLSNSEEQNSAQTEYPYPSSTSMMRQSFQKVLQIFQVAAVAMVLHVVVPKDISSKPLTPIELHHIIIRQTILIPKDTYHTQKRHYKSSHSFWNNDLDRKSVV